MSEEKKDLIVVEPTASVALDAVRDPAAELAFGKKCAVALMDVVENSKNKLVMNKKTYLYFEHWQTIGRFFSVTSGTEWSRPIYKTDPQNGDYLFGYEAKANIYDKDGKVIGSAEASCLRDEKNWSDKPEFQLKSMAQTRAASKAYRMSFGWIPVLAGYEATPAEEIDGMIKSEDVRSDVRPSDWQTGAAVPAPFTPKPTAHTAFKDGKPQQKPCKHCGTPIDRLPDWRVLCYPCYKKDKDAGVGYNKTENTQEEEPKASDLPF